MVWFVTPLFMALVMVEIADVIFAVDSVPAIFAITTDPFIVYTSNIFAILGLRALYFALAAMIHRFQYLKPALAMVLIFIGSKIFVADLLGLEKFPAALSLGVTLSIIAAGIFYSLWLTRRTEAPA
jgi:tellurite resistance protein TerC